MTNALDKRIAKMEGGTDGPVIIVWRHHTETDEQAMERWSKEHPDRDLNKAGAQVYLIGWGATA